MSKDFETIAKAKAEARYPFAGEEKRPTGSQNEYNQSQQDFDMLEGAVACQQQAYATAIIEQCGPLVDALKEIKDGNNRYMVHKLAAQAIANFEQVDDNINPETGKPYFSGLDPNKFNKRL